MWIAESDEVSIGGGSETEIGYYQGEGLLLEDVLREQVCWQRRCGRCAEKIARDCVRMRTQLEAEQCNCDSRQRSALGGAERFKKKLQKASKEPVAAKSPARRPWYSARFHAKSETAPFQGAHQPSGAPTII